MFSSRPHRYLTVVLGCLLLVACSDNADSTGPLAVPNPAFNRIGNPGKKPEEQRGGNKKSQPTPAADTTTKTVTTASAPTCGTAHDPWTVIQPSTSVKSVKGVRWNASRTPVELSVSGVIGPMGGSLTIPGSNFVIFFSPGALARDTTITVVSKETPWVTYDFLPHGLRFAQPVFAVQGLDNTTVFGTTAMCSVFGAYLSSGTDTIAADNSATATETTLSFTYSQFFQWDGFTSGAISIWQLNHFSRYILASG